MVNLKEHDLKQTGLGVKRIITLNGYIHSNL